MSTHRVMVTKNFDLFVPHVINREFHENNKNYTKLEASLLKDGWWPTEPMIVYPKNGAGKHMIAKGHNKYLIAKKHGLAIYWMIDEKKIPIWDREDPGKGHVSWRLEDWLTSHIRAGKNQDYKKLRDFIDKTKIPVSPALKLFHLNPESLAVFRRGDFVIKDSAHAEEVGEIVMLATDLQVKYSTKEAFIRALSQIVRTRVVSTPELMRKMRVNAHIMLKKQFNPDYLCLLKEVYNHKSQTHIAIDVLVRNALAEEKRKSASRLRKSKNTSTEFIPQAASL